MKLLVLGGTGGTGRHLVQQALDANHEVTVLVRDRARISTQHPRLQIVIGDASDTSAIAEAAKGKDAVLSALGLPQRNFYTVLFCISRMWGVIAQAVRARGEGKPIMRPISLTTAMVEEAATGGPAALDPYFMDE